MLQDRLFGKIAVRKLNINSRLMSILKIHNNDYMAMTKLLKSFFFFFSNLNVFKLSYI